MPAEIDRIFHKMVAKKPADRYRQTSDLVADLEAWGNPGATASFSGGELSRQDSKLGEFLRSIESSGGRIKSKTLLPPGEGGRRPDEGQAGRSSDEGAAGGASQAARPHPAASPPPSPGGRGIYRLPTEAE